MLADWEAGKRPLEPAEIAVDPNRKMVGHSSKHLRCEDFQLLKTLGTGKSQRNAGLYAPRLAMPTISSLGTFARVWLARLANPKQDDDSKVFALKILRKVDGTAAFLSNTKDGWVLIRLCTVIRLKQVEHVRNERNVLASVAGHPFITTMVASFQDRDSLYMLVSLSDGQTWYWDNVLMPVPARLLPWRRSI